MWVEDWAARAACKGDTPDALFVRGAEQTKAKKKPMEKAKGEKKAVVEVAPAKPKKQQVA